MQRAFQKQPQQVRIAVYANILPLATLVLFWIIAVKFMFVADLTEYGSAGPWIGILHFLFMISLFVITPILTIPLAITIWSQEKNVRLKENASVLSTILGGIGTILTILLILSLVFDDNETKVYSIE
jgi:hypothetical protein